MIKHGAQGSDSAETGPEVRLLDRRTPAADSRSGFHVRQGTRPGGRRGPLGLDAPTGRNGITRVQPASSPSPFLSLNYVSVCCWSGGAEPARGMRISCVGGGGGAGPACPLCTDTAPRSFETPEKAMQCPSTAPSNETPGSPGPGAWGAGAATLACQKSRKSSHQTRANEKSGKSYL
eukprot:gene25564-biopygen1462